LLADLLDVELSVAQQMVRDTAKEIPKQELDELVREIRRLHEFGVLPPDSDSKGN
jgi:hypothetical protein